MTSIEEMERSARLSAKKQIIDLFKNHNQLDNIESIRAQQLNQKLATEAQLRMAVHRQIDEAESGLNKLKTADTEAKNCDSRYTEMEYAIKKISGLPSSLSELRNLTIKYNQLTTAKENMNYLIRVDEALSQAKNFIETEDFLDAHKIIQELESIRDDLMLEVKKTKNQRDIMTLQSYFQELIPLNKTMEEKIAYVGKNLFNAAVSNNFLLVSIVRVVDREERIDAIWNKNFPLTNFMPEGRPKKWKELFFNNANKTVYEKVNYCSIKNDELVQTFELIRVHSLANIKLAKNILVTYFPSDYNIFETVVAMYHNAIAQYINNIIGNSNLDRKNMSSILMFLKRYHSEEFMGNEYLKIDLNSMKLEYPIKLIEENKRIQFFKKFVDVLEANCTQWMRNSLNKDIPEWSADAMPSETGARKYYTSLPVMINQVFTELLGPKGLFRSMDPEIASLSYPAIFGCLKDFSVLYKKEILNLHKLYKEGKHGPYYSEYVIANLYNASEIPARFIEIFEEEMRDKPMVRPKYSRSINELHAQFKGLTDICLEMTLEQIFVDLKDHFEKLMTREWLQDGDMTHFLLTGTLTDYNNLWVNMPDQYYEAFVRTLGKEFLLKYLINIITKKISSITKEERIKAGEKMIADKQSLQSTFEQMIPNVKELLDAYEAIYFIGVLLKSEFVNFDCIELVNKFPDISEHLISSILQLRGDLKLNDIKTILAALPERTNNSPLKIFYSLEMKVLKQ